MCSAVLQGTVDFSTTILELWENLAIARAADSTKLIILNYEILISINIIIKY